MAEAPLFRDPVYDGAADDPAARISVIQAAPLRVENGILHCDRDSADLLALPSRGAQ